MPPRRRTNQKGVTLALDAQRARPRAGRLDRRPRAAWIAGFGAWMAAAAAACGGPGFSPSDQVQGLRVIAAKKDKPYAHPGDTVGIDLTVVDGHRLDADAAPLPEPKITWIVAPVLGAKAPDGSALWTPACINPSGDLYYQCYSQFQQLSGALPDAGQGAGADGGAPHFDPDSLLGLLPSSSHIEVALPSDIVDRRPPPSDPSIVPYGIAFVFFAVCQGRIGLAPAGSQAQFPFPLACFDENGAPVGADRFVPGYTVIYAYDPPPSSEALAEHPERYPVNQNPELTALELTPGTGSFIADDTRDGGTSFADAGLESVDSGVDADADSGIDADADSGVDAGVESGDTDAGASLLEAGMPSGGTSRAGAASTDIGPVPLVGRCTASNRDHDCPNFKLTPVISPSSAEIDYASKDRNGNPLREELWIDYYATRGDFSHGIRLVNDSVYGQNADQWTEWRAPPEPGLVRIWAIVHDNRGGVDLRERDILVQ